MILLRYFLYFMIYSFAGWLYESVVCSVGERRLINRGFLTGPVCPVYGFGALLSILVLYGRVHTVALLFITGMALTCALEYLTAVLLETLFHAKWWDYSGHRFNFQGRVCLLGAVVFGALTVLLIRFAHPVVEGLVDRIPDWLLLTLSLVILVMLLFDLFVTVRHLLLLNGRLKEIQSAINAFIEASARKAGELRGSLMDRFEESDFYSERIRSLLRVSRLQSIRLARAFPKLRPFRYNDAWQKLKKTLLSDKNKK